MILIKFIVFFLICCSAKAQFFQSVVKSIAQASNKILRLFDIPSTPVREPIYGKKRRRRDSYDFIVVGMGPGGCVVTNRLTEDPTTTVMLLENGMEDNVITDIPIVNAFTLLTDWNYNFETEYDPRACQGMTGRSCHWASGKGPGGGTILSGLIWTRGDYRDYDSWAINSPGWSYREILPYFRKTENMMIPNLRGSQYHGTNGRIPIDYAKWTSPLLEAFLQAGKYFGFNLVDYNHPASHIGFSKVQFEVQSGERVTSASAYIKPILGRNNFDISLRSRVIKILIEPDTKRAFGVVYVKEGKQHVVFAHKEVVISAGAFNSPQLLMLSGIGHSEHLYKMGIPVLSDLPVGDNLMEHVGMHGLTFLINQPAGIGLLDVVSNIIPNALQYFIKSKGVLTSFGSEGIAFIKSKLSNTTLDQPDIELLFIPSSFVSDAGILLRKTFDVGNELYDFTYRGVDGKDSYTIWPMLMYPKSRGQVRLKDGNPINQVRITHNFLKEQIDANVLVEGIKLAISVALSPPFNKYEPKLLDVPFPQCRHIIFGTDAYWECAARTMTTIFHHQCGTCSMGSVVDHRLRVIGISGLRVVDSSVIPSIPSGHTQATTYMIAEKGAHMIKQDWNIDGIQ